jgi:Ser/Thr protein kinase RdoA (MazF antagonist)
MSLKDKAYYELSPKEQEMWWFINAQHILSTYDLPNRSKLKWLGYTHNAVFEFECEGKRYILRMRLADMRDFERHEVKFLRQLREDTPLIAPYPIANADNQLITGYINKRLKVFHHIAAVVFEYVEGNTVSVDTVSVSQMQDIGKYLANLHKYTSRYHKIFDEEDRYALRRLSPHYPPPPNGTSYYYLGEDARQAINDEQLTVMEAVAEKVKAAMDELGTGESEFGLIHGDLLLQNILFHEGEVRALDFEYCGWGYYLYDLTPILWQLKPQARYPELEQALWDGYTSIRSLSSRHRELLETFIAGRQVASMRWVAANRHNPAYQGKVEGIMVQRAAELQGFLETGILKRK